MNPSCKLGRMETTRWSKTVAHRSSGFFVGRHANAKALGFSARPTSPRRCRTATVGTARSNGSLRQSGVAIKNLETDIKRSFAMHWSGTFLGSESFKKVLWNQGRYSRGRKPVAPDLWLTTANRHLFIEVKLPGDTIARHQLVGLALIAMYLRGDKPISVRIVNLYSGVRPARSEKLAREFHKICDQLSTVRRR